MEIINAIVLGIIQGLTEFLPVSSSGHLEIAKQILGEDKVGEKSLLMTVVLHFATALATIFVFKKDIYDLFNGLFEFKQNSSLKFSWKIIISMIPAVIIGLAFEQEIESFFGGDLVFVGAMLIITALLLWVSDKQKSTNKKLNKRHALLIGIAQAIAILPGISRSGATISIAVLLGIDKEVSARFSFLMVVPLICGKMLLDIFSGQISYSDTSFISLLIGFIFAFITGVIACKWMILIVKKSNLKYFGGYCAIVGLSIMILSFT